MTNPNEGTHANRPRNTAAARSRPLFLQRRFLPVWAAFSLGAFADNMLRQSLIIGIPFGFITLQGVPGGDGAVPVIGAIFAVAIFIFSSLAGQVADKNETAAMFRRTKFAELLIMAMSAYGFYQNDGLVLVASLFLMAAQSAFFSPVRIGAMPKYFSADELIKANAYFNSGLFVSILLGLMIGGALIALPHGGRLVAGLLFLASLLGWIASLWAPPAGANEPGLRIDWNLARQAARMFRFALEAPGVSRPLFGIAFFYFTSTNITVLTPIFARDALEAPGFVANSIMGRFAVGAGLGAWSASLWAKGRSGLGLATFGIFAATVATVLVVALTPAAARDGVQSIGALFGSTAGVALAASLALSAGFMSLYLVPLQAAMQRRAPAETRARIMAASNMTNAAAATAGSLSALAVTQTPLTAQGAYLIVAALQVLVVIYMVARRKKTPSGLYDEALLLK